MKLIINKIKEILSPFKRKLYQYRYIFDKKMFGYYGKNIVLRGALNFTCPKLIFLYDNVRIMYDANFIMNPKGGKFIMKKDSGAAAGLTVINHNHAINPPVNKKSSELFIDRSLDKVKDIIIEEEVWIGTNVILLPGTHVGRGAIIGAGSVCRNKIPPYSIVIGNPSKVIGFKYSVEEIIQHELIYYTESERINKELLEKNYENHYKKKITDILRFIN